MRSEHGQPSPSVDGTEAPPRSGWALLRSTGLAAAVAVVILVLLVLPAAYGVDLTGIGRALGLTQRGQMNMTLAADAAAVAAFNEADAMNGSSDDTGDVTTVVLFPTEEQDVTLIMRRGSIAAFSWTTDGGLVDFVTYGDTAGAHARESHSYGRGTDAQADSGTIAAVFDGAHGWRWVNRSSGTVVITLRTSGDYLEVRKPM